MINQSMNEAYLTYFGLIPFVDIFITVRYTMTGAIGQNQNLQNFQKKFFKTSKSF
jgi:hypothetical protein